MEPLLNKDSWETMTQFYIEHQLASKGLQCRVRFSSIPLQLNMLDAAQLEKYRSIPYESRRLEWLKGRSALLALGPLSANDRTSLTYCNGVACAIKADAVENDFLEIGIDWETIKRVDERKLRFFLTPDEQVALGNSKDDENLIRLWTLKEAMFKADPYNADSWYSFYQVGGVTARQGVAENMPSAYPMSAKVEKIGLNYLTHKIEDTFISIATSFKQEKI